jgi:5-(carboxyamino)imidazole ribonucleotide synthase
MRPEPLPIGSTIGIFGGGQLGRFLAMAASKLGLRTAIYAPEEDSPAFQVASQRWQSSYSDEAALAQFAKACDVITFEFENVPAAALEIAARHKSVRPSVRAAEIAQDRMSEKRFLSGIGLPTAAYSALEGEDDVPAASFLLAQAGTGVLKIAREGYDGKGQARVSSEAELRSAFLRFAAPCVLEALVRFSTEISVIAVRSAGGDVLFYDCPENTHAGGILRKSAVPASCSERQQSLAQEITALLAAELGYCGVMGVEFFVMPPDSAQPLLVNEIAPRVHNSGHWTMEACAINQFENHIRAIADWPLGSVARHSDAIMTNLVGEEALDWRSILERDPGASLYLYGKTAIREGRKLGHVTQISPRKKNEDNPHTR